jgi:hypothetical protein
MIARTVDTLLPDYDRRRDRQARLLRVVPSALLGVIATRLQGECLAAIARGVVLPRQPARDSTGSCPWVRRAARRGARG